MKKKHQIGKYGQAHWANENTYIRLQTKRKFNIYFQAMMIVLVGLVVIFVAKVHFKYSIYIKSFLIVSLIVLVPYLTGVIKDNIYSRARKFKIVSRKKIFDPFIWFNDSQTEMHEDFPRCSTDPVGGPLGPGLESIFELNESDSVINTKNEWRCSFCKEVIDDQFLSCWQCGASRPADA